MDDFSKEEYQALRSEIDAHIAREGQLEVSAVAASGFVYAWLATHNIANALAIPILAWFIPPFFVLFGGLRSHAIARQIKLLGEYVRGLEAEFPRPSKDPRYEQFLKSELDRERSGTEGNKKRGPADLVASRFWLVFFVVTVAASLAMVLARRGSDNLSSPSGIAENAAIH